MKTLSVLSSLSLSAGVFSGVVCLALSPATACNYIEESIIKQLETPADQLTVGLLS